MTGAQSISAAIYDIEGETPTDDELAFFRDVRPAGFILFRDHCSSPEAVRRLTDQLKNAVEHEDVFILIDQEGGRVQRMRPPSGDDRADGGNGFRAHSAPAVFGELYKLDPAKARDATRLNAFLLARMISSLGVNVNCAPMLDVPQIDTTDAIGDRALAMHQDIVADLAAAWNEGSIEGGALPVIKHLPGHGRAVVDSHEALPRIGDRKEDLRVVDFAPFKSLNKTLLGMTGHVVVEAYDPARCATMSSTVINDVIRGEIGFDGLLFSDDLRMHALDGVATTESAEEIGKRAGRAIAAGCDVALCCNFTFEEKKSRGGCHARP